MLAPLSPFPLAALIRWVVPADISPARLAAWRQTLDAGEQARAARFHQPADAAAYVAAHGLLRQTLSEFARSPISSFAPADWVFTADERGKPRLITPDGAPAVGAFSLTHTRGLAACAVTDPRLEVGIDAESLNRKIDPLAIARRFFTRQEADDLARLTDPDARRRAFIRLWTLKEAVVKATGDGLAESLQGFSFSLDDPPNATIHDPALTIVENWCFHLWRPAGCIVALALRGAFAQKIDIDFQPAEPPR